MTARPSVRLMVGDAIALICLTAVAASPFHAAYGGWRWLAAVGGGLVIGLAVAAISARASLGPWLTASVLFVVYLLFGAALAVPQQALAGVVPDPDSLRSLATGVVHAWRDSLTLITPLGTAGTVLVVPYLVGLLSGVLAGLLLWRGRLPALAGLVPVAAFVAAAAFGDQATEDTLARGIALAAGLLIWTRWRAMRDTRVAVFRRITSTVVVLAVAGSAAAGITLATTAEGHREVLRDHVEPPFDPLAFPSPLSRFRAYYDEAILGDKTMFRATGLERGDLIRIATMDTFDGIVWNVAGGTDAATQSGSFGRLAHEAPGANEDEITIEVADYSGPWVPTVGDTKAVEVTREGRPDDEARSGVLFNKATGTMAQLGGVERGSTYRFRITRPPAPDTPEALDAAAGPLPQQPPDIPALSKRSQTWLTGAAEAAGGGMARALADSFRDGYYSDGKPGEAQSAAGHGIKRITDLVTPEQMVGNAEQYASAMGIAAQQHGLPARVVLGFKVPDDSGEIRGKDITAWVEVDLEKAGWVAFEPTPDKDRRPRDEQEDPEPEPQPYVMQPPVLPEDPDDADKKAPQGAGQDVERDPLGTLWGILVVAAYAAGAAAVLSPIWLLLLVKAVRRRRRRRAADPVVRVSGGWKEVADRARDLGIRLPRSNTRYENGLALASRFPASQAVSLATRADEHVFGPAVPGDREVEAYWTDVDTALTRMRKSAPWWRRPIAVLSPASIPWRAGLTAITDRVRRHLAALAATRPVRFVKDRLPRSLSLPRRRRKVNR